MAEPAPGTQGRLLNPVVGDGEGGDSTGFSLGRADFFLSRQLALTPCSRYFTLPTATALRLSSTATQAPEFLSDWRFR
jgi:hypothetical protein